MKTTKFFVLIIFSLLFFNFGFSEIKEAEVKNAGGFALDYHYKLKNNSGGFCRWDGAELDRFSAGVAQWAANAISGALSLPGNFWWLLKFRISDGGNAVEVVSIHPIIKTGNKFGSLNYSSKNGCLLNGEILSADKESLSVGFQLVENGANDLKVKGNMQIKKNGFSMLGGAGIRRAEDMENLTFWGIYIGDDLGQKDG